MATALSFITGAMVEIGAYAPGETLAPAHQELGLLRFQYQLQTWQADMLALYLQQRSTFTLPSGSSSFTIGPTGDIATTRPVFIEGINYLNPGSSPATEVPMAPMGNDQYMALSQKALSSSLPQMYHLIANLPNATVAVWPVVDQNVGLVVYMPKGVSEPAALTDQVTGPQGYAEAFLYQLALRLCGPMARPIPEGLPEMASAAYARAKRPNTDPGILGLDAALTPTFGSGFNILTGTTSGPSNY